MKITWLPNRGVAVFPYYVGSKPRGPFPCGFCTALVSYHHRGAEGVRTFERMDSGKIARDAVTGEPIEHTNERCLAKVRTTVVQRPIPDAGRLAGEASR